MKTSTKTSNHAAKPSPRNKNGKVTPDALDCRRGLSNVVTMGPHAPWGHAEHGRASW